MVDIFTNIYIYSIFFSGEKGILQGINGYLVSDHTHLLFDRKVRRMWKDWIMHSFLQAVFNICIINVCR